LKIGFRYSGQGSREAEMKDLIRYRALESLCRQSAVFNPHDSWRLLAQAEMWHHKALAEIETRGLESSSASQAAALARTETVPDTLAGSRRLAG
jgi:hypothetical protein